MAESVSVERWEVTLQGLVTPVGFKLNALRILGTEAGFGTDPFTYRLAEPADFEALILEESLESFVRTKLPDNFEDAKLALEPGRIVVKATVRVILPVSATAVCTLRIDEGKRIFVVLESVEMLGAGVKGLVQKQIDAINPILDVSEWPAEASLQSIAIEAGRVIAFGTLRPRTDK